MSVKIHPTAIIDPKAELDLSVEVGAYSVIGAGVKWVMPALNLAQSMHCCARRITLRIGLANALNPLTQARCGPDQWDRCSDFAQWTGDQ